MSNVIANLPSTHDDQTPSEVLRRNQLLAEMMSQPASADAKSPDIEDEDDEASTKDDGPPGPPQFVSEPSSEPAPRPAKAPPARVVKAENPQEQLQQLLSSKTLERVGIAIELPNIGPFEMELQAAGVCVNTDSLAFFVPKTLGKFKLPASAQQQITVTYHNKSYPVLYVGGFFTFPNMDYSLLSFLIVNDEPKT